MKTELGMIEMILNKLLNILDEIEIEIEIEID